MVSRERRMKRGKDEERWKREMRRDGGEAMKLYQDTNLRKNETRQRRTRKARQETSLLLRGFTRMNVAKNSMPRIDLRTSECQDHAGKSRA